MERMFGMSEADLIKMIEKTVAHRAGDDGQFVINRLSDAQALIEMGQLEPARQVINQAKFAVDRYIRQRLLACINAPEHQAHALMESRRACICRKMAAGGLTEDRACAIFAEAFETIWADIRATDPIHFPALPAIVRDDLARFRPSRATASGQGVEINPFGFESQNPQGRCHGPDARTESRQQGAAQTAQQSPPRPGQAIPRSRGSW